MTQSREKKEKPRIWGKFDQKWPNFFPKIKKPHFSRNIRGQLDAKKLRNPMVGSMRILHCGQRDRQRDGAGFIDFKNDFKNIQSKVS